MDLLEKAAKWFFESPPMKMESFEDKERGIKVERLQIGSFVMEDKKELPLSNRKELIKI